MARTVIDAHVYGYRKNEDFSYQTKFSPSFQNSFGLMLDQNYVFDNTGYSYSNPIPISKPFLSKYFKTSKRTPLAENDCDTHQPFILDTLGHNQKTVGAFPTVGETDKPEIRYFGAYGRD
jgi:hypothetical protein